MTQHLLSLLGLVLMSALTLVAYPLAVASAAYALMKRSDR